MPKKKSKRKRAQARGTGIGNDIKEAMKGGKLLIGSNIVQKNLKKGAIRSLILASNFPDRNRKDMGDQASVSGTEMKEFNGDSAQLGEACGKPFNVLIIGITK
jgi:large subunit ribosomal protein L30e